MKISLKLLISYFAILTFSIFGISYLYEFAESDFNIALIAFAHIITVSTLCVYSGFYFTENHVQFKLRNYVLVPIFGLLILTIAMISSPHDLDWKKGNGSVFWLVYNIYISPFELPIRLSSFYDVYQINSEIRTFGLITFAFIPYGLQVLGGLLKRNKTLPNKK